MIDIKFIHFFYVPNLLSLLRLMLIIPIYILLPRQNPGTNLILLVLIGIAILSDWLDGFFARCLNQKTDLGRILDPLADKILIVSGLMGMVLFRDFPLPLLLLLGYRDLGIMFGGIMIVKKSGYLTESNIFGKTNTLVIALAGFSFLIAPEWLGTIILLYLSYLSVAVSGYSYLHYALAALRCGKAYRLPIILVAFLPVIALLYFLHGRLI